MLILVHYQKGQQDILLALHLQEVAQVFSEIIKHANIAQQSNTFAILVPGAEQKENPEGDGACPDDPAGRVHPGPGAPAAADAAEAASGTHAAAAPDRVREPGGVQQPAANRATKKTQSGAAAAAQKPQGVYSLFLGFCIMLEVVMQVF